ncbi:hypothetical protein [Coraliomargarita parva]|uniref:hypothetical protein n=1 Tax=Coraliomargarita parva TaxID=3014050 RepID=UPI0022B3048A|nr:hypothetical protein [Coraliomargarita parva]
MSTASIRRISIDVTPEQHKRLKAIAALSGKSLKDYVLERTLPDDEDGVALRELEAFLETRVESARKGPFVDQSVEDIFDEVTRDANS